MNLIKLWNRIDTILMNSGNSKTSDPHRILLSLSDKINWYIYVALSNFSIYYTWENIKKSYKNNTFKTAPTWNEKFELPDGSYSVSDIEDYFKYNLKKHVTVTDNPSIMIYVHKIENRITLKIKTGYYLELLTPETMKLLGSTNSEITKDKNSENVPHLEITKLVIINCNIVNSDYQQDPRVFYTFVPNKVFGQLLDILPKKICIFQCFDSEFPYIEVLFTDQNSKPIEIEDKILL